MGQQDFREVIQGFNFPMKTYEVMSYVKFKSMPHLVLCSHFIVSSQRPSAAHGYFCREGEEDCSSQLENGKCKMYCYPSAPLCQNMAKQK